jgi:hypothetical protein
MFSGYTPRTMQMILAILVVFSSSSAAQAQEIDWAVCENNTMLLRIVFQQIGLFHEFVTYSCRHWRRDHAAMCKNIR